MGKAWKQAERDIAKTLQEWWRQVEPEAVFMRTPGSGAWATSHMLKGFKMRGDIMYDPATCKLWPFSVEIKFRKTVTPASIKHYEEGKRSPLVKFWGQCEDAATKDDADPFLIFRGNRQPWRCAIAGPGFPVYNLEDFLSRYHPSKFVRPRLPEQDKLDIALEKLEAMTPEQILQKSIESGIHDKNGGLTKEYR